jgi:hypothetical protein
MLRLHVSLVTALAFAVGQSSTQLGPATIAQRTTTAPELRVLVPAYFYPVANSPWSRLSTAAATHPGRIAAIGNPFNGPGLALDPAYAAVFADFRASGGTLLGYVYTSYATRPLAEVLADIDTWVLWYPLDGIFVDEMANQAGASEAYYRALYHHARSKIPLATVIGNPGKSTSPSYLQWNRLPVASAVCIFEGGSGFATWHADPWVFTRPRQEFYALPYQTSSSGWQATVDHAFAEHCGWLYVTDDVLPNPWDTLPAYFEALAAYVAAF